MPRVSCASSASPQPALQLRFRLQMAWGEGHIWSAKAALPPGDSPVEFKVRGRCAEWAQRCHGAAAPGCGVLL